MALVSLLLSQAQKGTRIDRKITPTGVTASIILDATISESYAAPIEITTHPVEKSVDISDHVILKPQTVTISGKISETPFSTNAQIAGIASSVAAKIGQELGGALGGIASTVAVNKTLAGVLKPQAATGTLDKDGKFVGKDVPGDSTRIRDAMNEFRLIRDSKLPVTIVTGLQQYKDYLLADFKVDRNQSSGGSIEVSLMFQELQTAESDTVTVAIPRNRNALPTTNQGKKKADALSGETARKSQSILSRITGVGGTP